MAENNWKMKRGAYNDKKNNSNHKSAKQLDQYFTKPSVALSCITYLEDELHIPLSNFETILEPSYGDGAFVSGLRTKYIIEPKLCYIDIDSKEPQHKDDFLSNELKIRMMKPFLTIGNPPFGKNSSLAINFFNKAATLSDVIAFILPRTFRKNSCINRLDRNFFLVFEKNLEKKSFLFEGNDYEVPCVFQIWSHSTFVSFFKLNINVPDNKLRAVTTKMSKTSDFEFVLCSDNPDFAIRRVGVNAGRIFNTAPALKSKESHLFIRVFNREQVESVSNKLKRLDLEKTESKYDTAGNPSICKDEICRLYEK